MEGVGDNGADQVPHKGLYSTQLTQQEKGEEVEGLLGSRRV